MQSSLLTKIILLLSLFHIVVLAAPETYGPALVIRQTTDATDGTVTTDDPAAAIGPTNPNDPQCLEYSRTANLSTIGANSTYRSAFIQASPLGTLIESRLLDDAIAKLPKMTSDVVLNEACGNLTTIAFNEAQTNFTHGIVAQFSGLVGNPQQISAGPPLVAIVGLIMLFLSGVWSFMI